MKEHWEENALRDILLEAANQEFAAELQEQEPVDLSPRFQKQMQKMLANPQGWAKGHSRPLWIKCAQLVATILLVCSLSLATLMAVSPTVRATVVHWVTSWYETFVVYGFFGENMEIPIAPMPQYVISDLPEGYSEAKSMLELPNTTEILYRNQNGQSIRFEYTIMAQGQGLMVSTENMIVSDITVNGCPGQGYQSTDSDQSNAVIWMNAQTNLQFLIDGDLDIQELLHIAESVSLAISPNS